MDEDAVISLHRSIATIVRVLKILEPPVQTAHGELRLSPADVQALRFLAENPEAMSSALAQHLGVAPTTATSVADRLVDRGFAERKRPVANRRIVALSLTPAGLEALSRLEVETRATCARMLDALPPDDRPLFVSSMETIAQEISRIR